MSDNITSSYFFFRITGPFPAVEDILKSCSWNSDADKEKVLSAQTNTAQYSHQYKEGRQMTSGVTGNSPPKSPNSHSSLPHEVDMVIVQSSRLDKAETLARDMHFRAVSVCEFLQLLWWFRQHNKPTEVIQVCKLSDDADAPALIVRPKCSTQSNVGIPLEIIPCYSEMEQSATVQSFAINIDYRA